MTKEANKIESIAYRILIEPWITEAATAAAQMNKYVFKVTKGASKTDIKKAVEALYQVTVLTVRTINIPSKKRMRGRTVGRKSGFRKAIVKIKAGESIDIFGKK
jgi:large subunit ribosomal protein L23